MDSGHELRDGEIPAIRYTGEDGLKLDSFLHLRRPDYVDLQATPMARVGLLEYEDLVRLADMLDFSDGVQLRALAEQKAKEAEEAKAARDARYGRKAEVSKLEEVDEDDLAQLTQGRTE